MTHIAMGWGLWAVGGRRPCRKPVDMPWKEVRGVTFSNMWIVPGINANSEARRGMWAISIRRKPVNVPVMMENLILGMWEKVGSR